MGGSSSSNSSSSTTNQTTTNHYIDDFRQALESGSIGATGSSTINIDVNDGGAIEAGTKLGELAFNTAEKIVLEHTGVLSEQVEDNAKEISETLIKSLFATVAFGALIWGWSKRK